MSKARLVITAVTAEGLSQREAARRYRLSQGWVSKLQALLTAHHRVTGAQRLGGPVARGCGGAAACGYGVGQSPKPRKSALGGGRGSESSGT
jgi:hypothetical protein